MSGFSSGLAGAIARDLFCCSRLSLVVVVEYEPRLRVNKGAPRFARREPLVFARGRIAKRFALIAKNDEE